MEQTGNWLEPLLRLQENDSKMDRLRQQIEAVPVQKKEVEDHLDKQQGAALAAKSVCTDIELRIKQINLDISTVESEKRKLLEKSGQVKDNHAYKALLAEAATQDSKISTLEDQALEVMMKLDEAKEVFKVRRGSLKKAVDKVEERMGDLDIRSTNCEKQLKILDDNRTALLEEVDSEVFSRYERIRNHHGPGRSAIVEISGDKCGHCHLKLTAQEILSAKKHVANTACANCGTLIYG